MKVFMGYYCSRCNLDFDIDSRNLDHNEPKCPECDCNENIKHVYIDTDEDEEE